MEFANPRFEGYWRDLRLACIELLDSTGNGDTLVSYSASFSELSSLVFKICSYSGGSIHPASVLYNRLDLLFYDYIHSSIVPKLVDDEARENLASSSTSTREASTEDGYDAMTLQFLGLASCFDKIDMQANFRLHFQLCGEHFEDFQKEDDRRDSSCLSFLEAFQVDKRLASFVCALENSSNLLLVYRKMWFAWLDGIRKVAMVFSYLEKSWVLPRRQLNDLSDVRGKCYDVVTLALMHWRADVLGNDKVRSSVLRASLALLHTSRTLWTGESSLGSSMGKRIVNERSFEYIHKKTNAVADLVCSIRYLDDLVDGSIPFDSWKLGNVPVDVNAVLRTCMFSEEAEATADNLKSNIWISFRSAFTTQSREFYGALAACISETPARDLILIVDYLIQEELSHLGKVLCYDPDGLLKIANIMINALIIGNQNSISSFTLDQISNCDLDGVYMAYNLLRLVPDSLKRIQQGFQALIMEKCRARIMELARLQKSAVWLVWNLWILNSYFRALVETAFESQELFLASIDQTFELILNRSDMGIQCLVNFCHILLDRGDDKIELGDAQNTLWISNIPNGVCEIMTRELQADQPLACVSRMFKYIRAKDMFQHGYSKQLVLRLLHRTTVGIEAEEDMLRVFRDVCGKEYIAKFQKMLSDYAAADSELLVWKAKNGSRCKDLFSAMILTAGAWTLSDEMDGMEANRSKFLMSLPLDTSEDSLKAASVLVKNRTESLAMRALRCLKPDMLRGMESFTASYLERHAVRKLIWLHQFGSVEISAFLEDDRSLRPTVHILASLIHVPVIMCFNQEASLSFQELLDATGIDGDILESILEVLVDVHLFAHRGDYSLDPAFGSSHRHKFVHLRSRVLNKWMSFDPSDETQDQSSASLNSLSREKSASEILNEDRSAQIQTTLMRIMKKERILQHSVLVSWSVESLSKWFVPGVIDIKRGIDSLLEKEYISRDLNRKDVYVYIA